MVDTPVLDELLRECRAYVGEHYVPYIRTDENDPGPTNEEYVGSDMDQEAVWDRAVVAVLGPVEFWERYDRREYESLTEEEGRLVVRAVTALGEVVAILQEAETQEEPCPVGSPGWAALFALQQALADAEQTGVLNPRNAVATYMFNVRGGIMDASLDFHQLLDPSFQEDEDDA